MADPTPAEMVTAYKAAIKAIVEKAASSYTIGGRTYSALDLDKLEAGLRYWERRLADAAGTRRAGVMRFKNI